ncbi:hypothetical protein F4604DRAFT_2028772 [Suillus subluteus]|nr:hypothetical protein F4604DRAFT_2028772 [Suillus subluteus]
MTFTRAHFESAAYVHCSVFKCFKNYQEAVQQGSPLPTAALCIMSRLKDDPRWFSYTDACYAENLSALSAPVLRGVARRIVTKSSDARNKECSVDAIVSHFASRHTELASMSDDILFKSLLTASVPPACTRSRGTLLAAEFQNLYGPEVATALRTPPVISSSPALDSAAMQASKGMSLPWISASVDDLARHLKKLKRTDIQTCIRRLAPRYRTLYNKVSHRKTCNALANHARQRALHLFHAGASVLGDVYLAYFPFLSCYLLSDKAVFCQILAHDFGVLVTERLSQEIVLRSVKDMSARPECKHNALAEARDIRTDRERGWPMPVSKEVVLKCLNGYMEGTMWTEPFVCAVCSQYDRDAVNIHLSGDISSMNLDLLRVSDDFVVKKCVIQNMSTCFAFDNVLIDGLMLEKRGIVFENSKAVELKVCLQCKSSLTQNKTPPLALANGLFRGTLPDQFRDLTWVEEKICAIYSITAHVTRLFQSSDPLQPKVFHGNTCAHDMNVMSTVSVLPRTPADINGFLSVVFIGPEKFDPNRMGTLFRVRKQKIWSFLVWLKNHNCLYADIELDLSILNQYPTDGSLPGLH